MHFFALSYRNVKIGERCLGGLTFSFFWWGVWSLATSLPRVDRRRCCQLVQLRRWRAVAAGACVDGERERGGGAGDGRVADHQPWRRRRQADDVVRVRRAQGAHVLSAQSASSQRHRLVRLQSAVRLHHLTRSPTHPPTHTHTHTHTEQVLPRDAVLAPSTLSSCTCARMSRLDTHRARVFKRATVVGLCWQHLATTVDRDQALSTVDRPPSPFDRTQRPTLCRAW